MNHQSQLQAGSLDYNGPRQFYRPSPQIIARQGGGEGSTGFHVRLPVPSSQTRIKLSIVFFPDQGHDIPDLNIAGVIHVTANEEDWNGAAGSAGRSVPVTDVEGTQNTPTPFPVSTGLCGYSREFVTAADWLEAEVSINDTGATGWWVLLTSIQPDAVTFEWAAWDQIRRAFIPQISANTGNF